MCLRVVWCVVGDSGLTAEIKKEALEDPNRDYEYSEVCVYW